MFISMLFMVLAVPVHSAYAPCYVSGGDDQLDDSTNVSNAFACAADTVDPHNGGSVVFRKGTYIIATSALISNSGVSVLFENGAMLKNGVSGSTNIMLQFTGNHLQFSGSVTLDQQQQKSYGVYFNQSQNVVWEPETLVMNGSDSYSLVAYKTSHVVFKNIYTTDSLILFASQPRGIEVSNVRARLAAAVDGEMIYIGGGSDPAFARDASLSNIDIDLGAKAVTTAIVISGECANGASPCAPGVLFDGVKVTNLSVRNNAAITTGTVGDGIDILRSKHVAVSNAVFRDLNVSGIVAAGSYMTLSNITASNCGAPCVQIHDPSEAGAFTGVTLSNIVAINGGTNTVTNDPYARASISLAPRSASGGTGTLSLVRLQNVIATGSTYGFSVTRGVSNVQAEEFSILGSSKNVWLEDPAPSGISFDLPTQADSLALFSANTYFDGANWVLTNNSLGAGQLRLDSYGQLALVRGASGVNPIGWTTSFLVDSTGTMQLYGPLQLNGGAPVTKHLSASFTVDLPLLAAGASCVDSGALSLPGAAVGDALSVGTTLALTASQQLSGFVASAGQVKVRLCQVSGVQNNPPSASFRADVWQH